MKSKKNFGFLILIFITITLSVGIVFYIRNRKKDNYDYNMEILGKKCRYFLPRYSTDTCEVNEYKITQNVGQGLNGVEYNNYCCPRTSPDDKDIYI